MRLADRVAAYMPGIRALRQGRHHDPPPADPHLGPAARPRPGRRVGGLRDGHRARGRGGADGGARRAVRLQRHQLLPARRHRRAGVGRAVRALHARARLRAARDDATRCSCRPPASAPRIAPTEMCTPLGWPCDGPNQVDAARRRCTTRPRGAWAAWPGTPACSRPRATCRASPHAAQRRHARRRAHPLAADRARMTTPSTPAGDAPTCAASAGTSTRRTRRTAATCSRSGRSATPASPARRSGSIRRRRRSWCSCRTACIPTARATSTPLRARVATIAASALPRRAAPRPAADATAAGDPARAGRRRRAGRATGA